MWINGKPLDAYGLAPVSTEGRIGGPTGALVTEEVPQRSGVFLTRAELDKPRRIVLVTTIRGTTEAEFHANRDAIQDKLDGALEVMFPDEPDKIFYAQYVSSVATGGEAPEFLVPNRDITITFECVDPFRYDQDYSVVGERIPVGTAPGRLMTIVSGAITGNLTLELRDFKGEVINRLKWDGTLSSTEWLEIRHNHQALYKYTALNSRSNAVSSLDSSVALFGFFAAAPDLARREGALWPRIVATTGTPTSVVNVIQKGWR